MTQFAVSKGCVDQLSPKSGGRGTAWLAILLVMLCVAGVGHSASAHPGHSHDTPPDKNSADAAAHTSPGAAQDSTAPTSATWYTYVLWAAFGTSMLGARALRGRPQRDTAASRPRPVYPGILRGVAIGFLTASFLVGGATLLRVWQDSSFDPVATLSRRLAAGLATTCASWTVFVTLSLAARKLLLPKERSPSTPATGAWLILALALASSAGLIARWTHDAEGRVVRSCYVAIVGLAVVGGAIAAGYVRRTTNYLDVAPLAWSLAGLAVLARGFQDDAAGRSVDSHIVGGIMVVSSLWLWRCQRLDAASASAPSPESLASAKDPS